MLPESQRKWNSGHKLSIEVEAQPVPQETTKSHKKHAKGVSRVKHRQREGTEPSKGTVRERKRASPADSRRTSHWQRPWSAVTSHSTNHTVSERRHGRGDIGKGAQGEGGRAKEPATRDALRGAKQSARLRSARGKKVREARTVTSDPSTICKDGTDKGSRVWNIRSHCSRSDGVAGERPM